MSRSLRPNRVGILEYSSRVSHAFLTRFSHVRAKNVLQLGRTSFWSQIAPKVRVQKPAIPQLTDAAGDTGRP